MDRYVKRLFHVCITVPDIEKALQFYRGVLGLQSIGSLRNERSDGAVLGFPGREIVIHADHLCGTLTDEATVIDLIEFVEPKTIVGEGPYHQTNHVGITRMAFDVDDTDSIYDKLRDRGDVDILAKPATVKAPTDGYLRILTFKDPHGIILELIERRQTPSRPGSCGAGKRERVEKRCPTD